MTSFLFGIALSSASIVLAIAAINLGKLSERAMIQRSDESIRLQNEVFARTTDALQRIESSTGVTERRIEDMISGRAGAISDRIVEKLVSDRAVRPRSRKALAKDVRESLLQELSTAKAPDLAQPDRELAKQAKEADAAYNLFNQAITLGISNLPETTSLKIGEGAFGEEGEGLFDGVYEVRGAKVGVCTFSVNALLADRFGPEPTFRQFSYDVFAELATGRFRYAVYVFDGPLPDGSFFSTAISSVRQLVSPEISSRLIEVHGNPAEALPAIRERLIAVLPGA